MSPDDRPGDRPDPESRPDPEARAGRETRASRRARTPERDPRDIVTEYAFQLDPDLLGVPLAGPFRRLGAMLVDLSVLALLFPVRAALGELAGGLVDLVVALAVAWMLVRLASPRAEGRTPSGWVRFLLRGAALVIALVGLGSLPGGGDGPEEVEAPDRLPTEVREMAVTGGTLVGPGHAPAGSVSGDASGPRGSGVTLGDLVGGARGFLSLARADSLEEARPAAEDIARQLHGAGASPSEIEETIRQLLARDGTPEPWMEELAASVAGTADSLDRRERRDADSLAARYARALTADDSAAADSIRPPLIQTLAGDRIDALERRNRQLRAELDRTEDELDEATSTRGLLDRTVDVITDDLGIGLGWMGLYFTVFLTLWDGRTPGKRLLGARVVQLQGRRLGWWDAFGRFGGYAAGVVTGMLGFLQVFWDPNRQALHDKIAGTVVIRTRGPGRRYEPEG